MAANLLQQGQQCQADALGLLDRNSCAIPQAEHGQLLEKYEKLQNQWSDVRAKGPSLFQGTPEHFQFRQWEQSAQELNGAVTVSELILQVFSNAYRLATLAGVHRDRKC
ncbi:hypothetical protein OBBRIDRAFT_793073 [Obba rivulosa]|uniref:Uncharacterized protein n=1 Tax=Obba rivulosa TaxID=1052685 RepID=A0A8E2B1T3_9APHY|nr:hypothetical protein OBBRIDRAFT_793073 [Obba rivulosa]